MKTELWDQIEKDFIEWDNEGHSNASQRQILNWFMVRLLPVESTLSDEEIEKQFPIIEIDEDLESDASNQQLISELRNLCKRIGAKWARDRMLPNNDMAELIKEYEKLMKTVKWRGLVSELRLLKIKELKNKLGL